MIDKYNKVPIPVPILQGGLKAGGLITEVTLNSATWTALPATPLTDRNGIGIQNPSNNEIKVNFATPAGYVGWIIASGGELFFDLSDAIIVYAKSKNSTPTITIMEIA